jgi:hypothetical protein
MIPGRKVAALTRATIALGAALLAPFSSSAQTETNAEAISREHSVFNFGASLTDAEAMTREVSVFNFGEGIANAEAFSREVSVQNFGDQPVNMEAFSREVSVFNFGQDLASSEALSGEVSVFNSGQSSATDESFSREVSVFNFGQSSADEEAVSREVSLFNFGQSSAAAEAVSREVSVFNTTNRPPRILEQPQNQTAVAGGSATFSVGYSGTPPLSYQWRFNASVIPDATNATLLLTNIQPAQEGLYRVLISNPFGTVLSKPATLTVAVGPILTQQPRSTNVNPGTTVTLFVQATGTAPLAYQWRRDGTNLSGATSSTLVLTHVQPAQAGSYDVTVSNAVGMATSSVAVVAVSLTPVHLSGIFELTNGGPRFHLTWTADQDFVVETSTDFLSWAPWLTNAAPLRVFELVDPGTGTYPQRFFRARSWP